MNGKRAKAYRKLIGDVSASYEKVKTHFKNFGTYNKPDWKKVTSTIKLDPTCGRSMYKLLKRIDI